MTSKTKKVNVKILCACGCGEEFWKYDSNWRERRFKSAHNQRIQSPNWRGGFIIREGYRLIYQPHHPRAFSNGYVYEHVVIMEQKLGRALLKAEDVHHINGNRQDNRPENLTNLLHGQHSELTNTKNMSNRVCIECGKNTTFKRHWYRPPEGSGLWCHTCRARYKWRQKQFFLSLSSRNF